VTCEEGVQKFARDTMRQGRHREELQKPVRAENNKNEPKESPNDDGEYLHGMMFPRSRGVRRERNSGPRFEFPAMFITGCRRSWFQADGRVSQSESTTDIA
jgi:hypothetical protein